MSSPTHRDDERDGDNHGGGERGGDEHRDAWDLIPWLVNGRLSDAERARVETHVAGCEECREEVTAQRALRERMAAESSVAYSPAASFERLWSRIEEIEREVPATERTDQEHVGQAPSRAAARVAAARVVRPSTMSRWLVAAVVVQSIALSWLVHGVLVDRGDLEWPYRTVTSPTTVTPATTRLRVVFARDITLSELQRILAAYGLSIVQGPAASEIFTLVPSDPAAPADAVRIVERLRAEPAVRFVELAASSAFATRAVPARTEPGAHPEIEP